MVFGSNRYKTMALLVWTLVLAAMFFWGRNLFVAPGWDLRVYEHAITALRAGRDPYADGVAVQRVFHAQQAAHATEQTPFTFVYSPITILPLRLLAKLPTPFFRAIYWLVYAIGALTAIWFGLRFAEPRERQACAILAPLALLCPGILATYAIFSGNLAYILYALVLAAALAAWHNGQWRWFYLAVLLASCIKAPLLVLVAIPVFSARRQWIPAAITGVIGVLLFAVQPLFWPSLFHNYLFAVELQFSFNHDFSASPAGLLAEVLYDQIPYAITTIVFYLFYAIPIAAILLHLSRRFLRGEISPQRWVPVLLIGVTLLNPRIMEYDVAAITIPMALVAWRFLSRGQTLPRAAAVAALLFGVWNFACAGNWRPSACMVLIVLFAFGVWDLWILPPILAGTSPAKSYSLAEEDLPFAIA
jgi:hypothetical protein